MRVQKRETASRKFQEDNEGWSGYVESWRIKFRYELRRGKYCYCPLQPSPRRSRVVRHVWKPASFRKKWNPETPVISGTTATVQGTVSDLLRGQERRGCEDLGGKKDDFGKGREGWGEGRLEENARISFLFLEGGSVCLLNPKQVSLLLVRVVLFVPSVCSEPVRTRWASYLTAVSILEDLCAFA